MNLQADVQHHGSHQVEVGELESEPPRQVEEGDESAAQDLGEVAVGEERGAAAGERQLEQARHAAPGNGLDLQASGLGPQAPAPRIARPSATQAFRPSPCTLR